MGIRFLPWQQIILIIAPVALLFAFVVVISLHVRMRSLRAALPRLAVVSLVFTGIWIIVDAVLFIAAFADTSDVTITYETRMDTYQASLGLPVNLARIMYSPSLQPSV